jgi:hypothetical protein
MLDVEEYNGYAELRNHQLEEGYHRLQGRVYGVE